jgi:hypothetical protein
MPMTKPDDEVGHGRAGDPGRQTPAQKAVFRGGGEPKTRPGGRHEA